MSGIPRLAIRASARASSSSAPLRQIYVPRGRSIRCISSQGSISPYRQHGELHPVLVTENDGLYRRKYATATALKEVEEEEDQEEEVWPVRVLPKLSHTDRKRLKRQRNVGM